MSFVEFREDWFDEGGYLDNTFSAPEMKLDKNVAEVLGANSITLQHGVYEMIQDGETGNYVVTIDVKFE